MDRTEWESGMGVIASAFDDAHGYTTATIELGVGDPLVVLVADTREKRARGMSGRGWGDADGMLFVYDKPMATAEFHMRDVGMDLRLLAFDSEGKLVHSVRMNADDGSGRRYRVPVPFQWALEIPVDHPAASIPVLPAVAKLVVAQMAPADQRSKADVNYRPVDQADPMDMPEMPDMPCCATCCNFMPPSQCMVVAGSIDPSHVSDLYSPASDADA